MASGKTAIGRALARRLGRPFIDSDREVEKSADRPISRIFAAEGERGFRRRETSVLRKIALAKGKVVALGGGAVLSKKNVSVIRRSGTVVYLQAPLAVLIRRGRRGGRKRPLWSKSLSSLFSRRRPRYNGSAHITIRAGRGGIDKIVSRILSRLIE